MWGDLARGGRDRGSSLAAGDVIQILPGEGVTGGWGGGGGGGANLSRQGSGQDVRVQNSVHLRFRVCSRRGNRYFYR